MESGLQCEHSQMRVIRALWPNTTSKEKLVRA